MHSSSGKCLEEDNKINVHIDCHMYPKHKFLVRQKTRKLLQTTVLQNLLFWNGVTSANYCDIQETV